MAGPVGAQWHVPLKLWVCLEDWLLDPSRGQRSPACCYLFPVTTRQDISNEGEVVRIAFPGWKCELRLVAGIQTTDRQAGMGPICSKCSSSGATKPTE